MQRRAFLKTACVSGLCSCTVSSLLAGDEAAAAPASPPSEDWRINFAKQRYGKLVSIVATKVDAKTFAEILEEVGRFCSNQGFAGKFAGNIEGYLSEMQKRWGAQTDFDKERGIVRVAFQTNGDCGCPLMSKATVPAAACSCSVGAIAQSFTVVSGRAARCELKESMLQGGTRCAFEIHLGTA